MNEMVERVARAIRLEVSGRDDGPIVGDGQHGVGDYMSLARVAIAAMREPTDAMATDPMATCYNYGEFGDKEVRRIWRAMIAAALR